MRILLRISAALAAAIAAVVGATGAFSAIELPPGPNRNLVYGQCRTCHDLQYLVESAGISPNAWADMVDSMREYGLRIPDEQRGKIVEYLGTYLGPNPPKADAAAGEMAAAVSGETVFNEQCVSCHQAGGKGLAKQFPPLAGNRDLFLSSEFPVHVLLSGLEGEIKVGGESFDSVMPPFDHLSDAEIAAVLQYVRTAWGNAELAPKDFPTVAEADVAKARDRTMDAAEVWKYRNELR